MTWKNTYDIIITSYLLLSWGFPSYLVWNLHSTWQARCSSGPCPPPNFTLYLSPWSLHSAPLASFHCPKYAGFNLPCGLWVLHSQWFEWPSCLLCLQIIIFHSAFCISTLPAHHPLTIITRACSASLYNWKLSWLFVYCLLASPIRTNSRRAALSLLFTNTAPAPRTMHMVGKQSVHGKTD